MDVIKQLETSELLKRFKDSRAQLAQDLHMPIYHFTSPDYWLNDPNGLCYWKGNWHLFYQTIPTGDTRQHWGHAVSKNLIEWKDMPYAIHPGPEKRSYSGTTLVEEDRVIAMYHGTEVGNMVAIANDDLLMDWKKLAENAVIPIQEDNSYMVYDPCIWKINGYYYALSGGAIPYNNKKIRADLLFKSEDLINWTYLHEFLERDTFTLIGDDGACPNFWPIGTRHILLFFSHMSGGQALLGDYDVNGGKFMVSSHHKANFGAVYPGGIHAPSATPDGHGGIVVIYNINGAKKSDNLLNIMSLPRILNLTNRDEISIQPYGSIEKLRNKRKHIGYMEIKANEEVLLDKIGGNAIEINAEIGICNSPMIELKILRSPNNEEYTRIAFYYKRGYLHDSYSDNDSSDSIICVDTSHSSSLEDVLCRPPENAPVFIKAEEDLSLRIFVDKSVVEVFVNGRQCVSVRVYPVNVNSTGISIYTKGKNIILKSLDIWQMNRINYS